MLTGVSGGVGQMLLTQAFRIAPAAVIAPFDYATLIWAGLLGYLLWGETPPLRPSPAPRGGDQRPLHPVAGDAPDRRRKHEQNISSNRLRCTAPQFLGVGPVAMTRALVEGGYLR